MKFGFYTGTKGDVFRMNFETGETWIMVIGVGGKWVRVLEEKA